MKRIVIRTAKTIPDLADSKKRMLVDGVDPKCYFLIKCISDHSFVPSVSFTTRFEIINVITDAQINNLANAIESMPILSELSIVINDVYLGSAALIHLTDVIAGHKSLRKLSIGRNAILLEAVGVNQNIKDLSFSGRWPPERSTEIICGTVRHMERINIPNLLFDTDNAISLIENNTELISLTLKVINQDICRAISRCCTRLTEIHATEWEIHDENAVTELITSNPLRVFPGAYLTAEQKILFKRLGKMRALRCIPRWRYTMAALSDASVIID